MPRYSKHARDRMSQRGIKKTWVETCLENADVVVEPVKGLRQHIKTMANGRRLKVVLDVENDTIVSAMWQ
jgi:hypothetical protein